MEHTKKTLTEGRAIDLFVAYRFLRILTTPWEDQPAFKHGIIDKDGKLLRKSKELTTTDEKSSFTLLHRLIFNLKRLLHKIPLVRSKLGTYATALFLLKQHFADQVEEDDTIENSFKKWLIDSGYITEEELQEEVIGLGDILPKGSYRLTNEVVPDKDGDMSAVGNVGDIVVAFSDTSPIDEVLGINIFKVIHQKSKTEIYVSLEDIEET
ncbi:MAG: hypothetical protein QGH83_12455 [Candidatus Pacebacteria bacterium]|jgi:hypothetical protein|nr:hypothetical protein [Candidatus Paceibacterota bacterium]